MNSKWCEQFLEKECNGKALLVPSCTAALELASFLLLRPQDEVILPSWAFPSCANAIIMRGAVPVFVDVDVNLNISPSKIIAAITPKTKAIMVIHYAGVMADMDRINTIAKAHGLYVIEDAAQAIGNWKLTGDIGCLSFHYTKNVDCGQGGAFLTADPDLWERAKIAAHCGTDKLKFYSGYQDYYSWLGVGSQYVMSEYQADVLRERLERLDEITEHRKKIWDIYSSNVSAGNAAKVRGNGHIFWFEMPDKWEWLKRMRQFGVGVTSHFDALHMTKPGREFGRASGPIHNATRAMQTLVKLNTGVSEDAALMNCELIWPGSTGSTRKTL